MGGRDRPYNRLTSAVNMNMLNDNFLLTRFALHFAIPASCSMKSRIKTLDCLVVRCGLSQEQECRVMAATIWTASMASVDSAVPSPPL